MSKFPAQDLRDVLYRKVLKSPIDEEYKKIQEKVGKLEKKVGDINHLVNLLTTYQVILYASY